MPPSLRELVPGFDPAAGMNELVPGYAPPAVEPGALRSPETVALTDQLRANDMTQFGRGLTSNRIGGEANYLASQEASLRAAGRHAEADAIRAQITQAQARAGVFAPAEQDVTNLGGSPLRALDWGLGAMGGMAGSMVDSMATGGAATMLAKGVGLIPHPIAKAVGAGANWLGASAAAVPNVLQARGETYNEMVRDPTLMQRTTDAQRNNAAWGSGAAQGLIDTALPAVMLRRLTGAGLKQGVHESRALSRIGKDALGSAAEETTQEAMKKATLGYLNPDRDTSDDLNDYINSAAAGFVGPAPISAASIAADNGFRRLGVKGDGERGDDIDLSTGETKPGGKKLFQDLGVDSSTSKYARRQAAIDRATLLETGSTNADEGFEPTNMIARGEARKAAILEDLAQFNTPEAQALAQRVSAEKIGLRSVVASPAMDDAMNFLFKKLKLDNESISKRKLNLEGGFAADDDLNSGMRTLPRGFGGNKGSAGTVDLQDQLLPSGERQKMNERQLKDAQTEIAALKSRIKLVTDKLWRATEPETDASKAGSANLGIIKDLAQELVAATTVKEFSTEEKNRAHRLAEQVVNKLGDKANDVMAEIGRISDDGASLFTEVQGRVQALGAMGNSASLRDEAKARDMAGREIAKLLSPRREQWLLAKHGVDMADPQDREHLLQVFEDFADGHSKVSLMKLNKTFGKETVQAMLKYVGGKIQPRLSTTEQLQRDSDAASERVEGDKAEREASSDDMEQGSDVDTEVESDENDNESDESSDAAFERKMLEKNFERLPPSTQVYHAKTRTPVDAADAFKGDSRPELLHASAVSPSDVTAFNALEVDGKPKYKDGVLRGVAEGSPLHNLYGRLARAADSAKNAPRLMTVRSVMEQTGVPPSRRVALMVDYLKKAGHATADNITQLVSDINYLEGVLRDPERLGAQGESLSPHGGKTKFSRKIDHAALEKRGAKVPARANIGAATKIVTEALERKRKELQSMPLINKATTALRTKLNREPTIHDIADYYFENRFLAVAQQDSNRDYLQLKHSEFVEMAKLGAARLKKAQQAGAGWSGEAKQHEVNKAEAAANVIRFLSPFSAKREKDTDGNAEIAIPSSAIVKWVNDQRNAHTKDLRSTPPKSNSENAVAERFLQDLLEGITALTDQGFVAEGTLPYIINAEGKRENFQQRAEKPTEFKPDPDESAEWNELEAEKALAERKGALPPSLDLNGKSVQEFKASKAYVAQNAREKAEGERNIRIDELAHLYSKGKRAEPQHYYRAEQTILREEETARAAEISKDALHELEGEEANQALDKQAAEVAGSKRGEEQYRHHDQQQSIFRAAADAPVVPLTKSNAYFKGRDYGDSLWRSYLGGSADRILAMVRALDLPASAYDENGDVIKPARIFGEDSTPQSTALLGGRHNIAALAYIVTPERMALVNPEDKALFEGIRSRVASVLLGMGSKISPANKGRLVDVLSGRNGDVNYVKSKQRDAFLQSLAQAHVDESVKASREAAKFARRISKMDEALAKEQAENPEAEKTRTFEPIEQQADPAVVAAAKKWVGEWDMLQSVMANASSAEEYGAAAKDAKKMLETVKIENIGGDKGAPIIAKNVRPTGRVAEQPMDAAVALADKTQREAHNASKREAKAAQEKAVFATLDQLAKDTPPPAAPAKFQPKEKAKLKGAKFVLAPTSATEGFAGDLARWALSIGRLYNPSKTALTHGAAIYVSVPGANRGWTGIKALIQRAEAALDRGFQLRTDNEFHATRSHNAQGEGALRSALIAHGYREVKGELYSTWVSDEAQVRLAKSGEGQREDVNDGQFDAVEESAGNPDEGSFEDAAPRKLNQEVDVGNLKKMVNEKRKLRRTILNSMKHRTEVGDAAEAAISAKNSKMDELTQEINELRRIIQENTDAGRAAKAQPKAEQQAKAAMEVELDSEHADAPTREEISKARSYIARVLGPKVRSIFLSVFDAGGEWIDAEQLVKIATANPQKIMQKAYHESMHGFFSNMLKHHPEARQMLEGVMSDPKMITRLESLLRAHPKAVESMKLDPEERVAYAYQFWAAGLLDVDEKPKNWFQKVQAFMRKVFGAVRDSEKALAIFESFYDGKLVEPSAAGEVITKIMQQGEWRKLLIERMDKQVEWANSMTSPAHDVMRNSESATVRALADLWWANPADSESAQTGPGVLNRRAEMDKKYNNHFWGIISKLSDRDLKDLGEALSNETPDADIAQLSVVKAREQIYELNRHFYKYLKTAGVKMGVRGAKYYPTIWNMEKMINGKAEFVEMLKREYPHMLVSFQEAADGTRPSVDDVASAIHQAIIDRGGETEGNEAHRENGILNPYFAASNTRSFDWIRKEHSGPFLENDVVAIMTRYLAQGVRSAEYVRSFESNGQKLKDAMARAGQTKEWARVDGQPVRDDRDLKNAKVYAVSYEEDGPVLRELYAEADKLKLEGQKRTDWVERRYEDIERSMGAMEGVLGKNITPGLRKFNSAVMVYQNLRLLPLSIFAAMLDPNGIKVAGGDWDDMFQAYMRGMKEVMQTWKDVILGDELGHRGADADETNAMIAGTIDSTMYLENRGEAHTSEYSSGTARKINHALFLANGLSAWDRSMRIVGTKAAMKFIARHNGNANKEHSARWMKDLGLEMGSVELNENSMPIIDRVELANKRAEANGTTRAQEQAKADTDVQLLHTAINRWVSRAVLSPNAAQRPAWSSDPHYAPFFHLKQFTYSFQHTTMKYAMNEAAHGNNAALAQLTMGIPIMIVADVTKALLTGGGSLPGYMQSWNFGDWLGHAWNRAGLNGTKQFGLDLLSNPASLPGPMFNQIADAVMDPIGKTINSAVPGLRYLHLEKADMVKDFAD